MAAPVELAVAFERAVGERLLSAERFLLSLPQLFRGIPVECDLAYRVGSRFFVAVARLSTEEAPPKVRARVQFWCARAGGVSTSLSDMAAPERAAFDAQFERCDLKVRRVGTESLSDAAGRIATEAGAPADRPRTAQPQAALLMDVGGHGWEGVLWGAASSTLFIPGNYAPPVGDEVPVWLRFSGVDRPVELEAHVSDVRTPGAVAPGAPAGFTLTLRSPPPQVAEALAKGQRQVSHPEPHKMRAAPRYPVRAPVKVVGAQPGAEGAAAPAVARIEYATDQELAADYLDNLSQGGAFVRTARPAAVGSALKLQMRLPGGVELEAAASVAFTNEAGMGVKFHLEPADQEKLAGVIARISARPRRALLVDDDPVVRKMLSKALEARGFEVLVAADGATGLQLVTEELLTLDLLVTDLNMPHIDGEAFIRTIRGAGGESDLAIVVVTANTEPGLEKRLQAVGADTVLEKALGPALIAQAADAMLERKRLVGGD